jgi:hypothetical protein
MTSEVLPDVNDFQEDDSCEVIFNDDDGTVRFEDPERPDPEDVLDRFNGMSYHLEQEYERRIALFSIWNQKESCVPTSHLKILEPFDIEQNSYHS